MYSVYRPAGMVNAASILLTGVDDHELLRMGVSIMHTMLLQLTDGSAVSYRVVCLRDDVLTRRPAAQHDQDNSWRFSPFLLGVLRMAELSLWCTLTSSQMDISTTAQRCLRLLSIFERNPAVPPAPKMSAAEISKRRAVLEGLGDPQSEFISRDRGLEYMFKFPAAIITGKVSFQKRIRKHVAMISRPSPIHMMVSQEVMFRWSRLTPRVEQRNLGMNKGITFLGSKDELHEWQNNMCLLAAGGRSYLHDEMDPFSPILKPFLPQRLHVPRRQSDMIKQFILEVIRFLSSDNLTIRESAKETLGNELHPKLLPIFFELLNG
jgi:hypothetical protein